MDKKAIKLITNFLRVELELKGIKLIGVALFGSQMKGTATPDSDIDMILISNSFKNKNFIERSDLTMDAEIKAIRKFKIPLDILKMTSAEYQQGIDNKRYNAQLL
ncbi:MAG: nucleotidyltransferase domain-containing protein [Bacteroidota bacterium]